MRTGKRGLPVQERDHHGGVHDLGAVLGAIVEVLVLPSPQKRVSRDSQ